MPACNNNEMTMGLLGLYDVIIAYTIPHFQRIKFRTLQTSSIEATHKTTLVLWGTFPIKYHGSTSHI